MRNTLEASPAAATHSEIASIPEIVAELRAGRMVIWWTKKTAKMKATW